MSKFIYRAGALALALTAAGAAQAHTGDLGGFQTGILHPLTGLDHLVAMVAVGLWGAVLGRPLIWVLPVAFPLAMALAATLAILGMPLPGVEIGIALSGLLLGLAILGAVPAPTWAAVALVGVFAAFHGHAHGTELPAAVDPAAYAAGFVVATGGLHLLGVALGTLWQWQTGRIAVRATGGVIAAAGAGFATGVL